MPIMTGTAPRTGSFGQRARTRPAPYAPQAPMSGYQTQQQQAVRQQPQSALTAMPRPQTPVQAPAMGPQPLRTNSNTGVVGPPVGGRPMGQPGAPPYGEPRPAPPGGYPRAQQPQAPTYQPAPTGQQYAPTAPPQAYQGRSQELIYPGMPRRDLPMAAWQLNEDQRMQAELDRIRGYEELERARNAIGTDPTSMQARELALDRAMNGGLFDDEYLDQQRGLIRNRGSIGMEAARRNLQDSLAQRGIAGGLSAFEMAQLDQSGALGIQEQLGGFEQDARAAQSQERAQGLEQLLGLTGREEASRSALDQALANVFLETERAPYDVSELTEQMRRGTRRVGGKRGKQRRRELAELEGASPALRYVMERG